MSGGWIRVLAVAAGCLGLACTHAGRVAAGAGAPPGPVTLRFGWPDALQLFVVVAQESRRAGSQPTGLLARQRLVSERRGDEIRVYTRDVAARGNEPELESLVKVNEALVQVVAPDGKFLRAEGLDEALAAIDPSRGGNREELRPALIRSSAFDWELMVEAWAGERFTAGDERRKQRRASVPLFGTVETLLEVEYGLEAEVPCSDEDTVRRCVALSYRARIAPEERAATVERIRRLTAANPGEPEPEDVHAELEVQLVTEPDTLVPHRMSQREHLRLRVHAPDGRVREAEQRSQDQYIFTSRPPAVEPEQPSRGI